MLSQTKISGVESSASELSIPDISIILVCWNNKEYLKPCLDSLFKGGLQSSFGVVVVDNGSTDGSQQMLQAKFPDVMIIQNDHNVGLGRASNQGIEATSGRYVLLLNNDTLVNGPSFDSMVQFMDETPDASAVGGRLINPDGSFQAGFANFPSLREEFLIATRIGGRFWDGYPSHRDTSQIQSVGWLSSACLLLRRTSLEEVGALDESFFIYGDEADLQYRLQKNGWPIYYLPSVTTIHYGGRSMDRWRRRKMVYRGKMFFFRKNYGAIRTLVLRVMIASLSLVKIVAWILLKIYPSKQAQSKQEIQSNLDVIKLCWHLE